MLGSRFDRAIVLIVVALLGGAWVFMSREQVANPRDYAVTEAPIVGHLAPDFTLKTPLGRSISLTDFVDRSGDSGRPVVLNYWASWCGPCRVETPELQSASLKYGEQIAILGINQGETPKTISEFGVSYGLTYSLLVDEANEVNREYGITSLPTTVFIDRNGVVREVFIGILTKATMTERLDRLIAGSR